MRALPFRAVVVSALVGVAVAFSCKTFDLPSEACDPSRIDSMRLTGEAPDGVCSRCLEDKCCDKIGVCANTATCVDRVRDIQGCVVDSGHLQASQVEQACADNGPDGSLKSFKAADDAYRCMRAECGLPCGLPVCRVDNAAVLIKNAACDRCVTGACCTELNACYQSRACKLVLECVNRTCVAPFGDGGVDPLRVKVGDFCEAGLPEAGRDRDARAPAGGLGASSDPLSGLPQCVRDCLEAYGGNDQGLKPSDGCQDPGVLAGVVFNCGMDAKCALICVDNDAGSDAGAGDAGRVPSDAADASDAD